MSEVILTIRHPAGLHMRPASLFLQTAARFKSTIQLANLDRREEVEVDAKSLFDIMSIGVSRGHRVRVRAQGEDADEALAALRELVAANFGDV
jgi:phosphotransferase system HPr (HPr) family protein